MQWLKVGDNTEDFVEEFLGQIEREAVGGPTDADSKQNVLIAIKICLEKLLGDLEKLLGDKKFKEAATDLIKMLVFFNKDNITTDMMVSCAETLLPDSPEEVSVCLRSTTILYK